MRVVSWNLWWRFGRDWRRRQSGIAATLQRLRPDVVGLQEVWAGEGTSQADALGHAAGLHPVFAGPSLPPPPDPPEAPDQEGIEVGVAVLSRWPVIEVRRHRLPARHRTPPVALHATLDHPSGPLHVVAACVEWEPDLADDHLAQTRALAALLTDPALDGPLPVLLTADLNAAPGTPQVRALTEVMVDTWAAAASHDDPDPEGQDAEGPGPDAPGTEGPGPAGLDHHGTRTRARTGDDDGVTLSSRNPYAPLEARQQIDQRIDYVLARPGRPGRPITVERAFVVRRPVAGIPPSDHYPVVADLRL